MRGVTTFLTLAACLAVPGFASAQTLEAVPAPGYEPASVQDPWEGFNRNLFGVHKAVDEGVLEPVARGYRAITPSPVRQGVLNFLRNLRSPVIFANDMLQGELSRAGTTAARFGVNTTVGVVGLFDPATSFGLERHDEDFGQTLAVWGVSPGPYVFVPLMGPTTVRDGLGRVVDMAFDPFTWADSDDAEDFRLARGVVTGIATRENLIETIDGLEASSLDPYVAYRSSYFLTRESAIQNGRVDVQDLPDFDDIDEPAAMETPAEAEAPSDGAKAQQFDVIARSQDAPIFTDALSAPISPSPMSGEKQ